MTDQAPLGKLNRREQVFVDCYLKTWKASEAARLAGYKGRADVAGARVMAKPKIRAMIEERISESAMGANEALKRLAEQARLNAADFFFFEMQDVIDPATGDLIQRPVMTAINWQAVIERGHLVKGVKYDRRGNVILEFHDAQTALLHIGKNLKLFSDQIDLNMMNAVKAYIGISPDDWDALQGEEK